MRPGLAAGKDGEVPRPQRLLPVGRAQRRRSDEYEEPLLLPDVPVVPRLLAWSELVDGAAPLDRADRVADPPELLEEVQNPIPSGAASGLRGSCGLGPPSLYSDGATSFGPSA